MKDECKETVHVNRGDIFRIVGLSEWGAAPRETDFIALQDFSFTRIVGSDLKKKICDALRIADCNIMAVWVWNYDELEVFFRS